MGLGNDGHRLAGPGYATVLPAASGVGFGSIHGDTVDRWGRLRLTGGMDG